MKVENCQNCGGTHFGQYDCPFDVGPAPSKGATGRKTNLRKSKAARKRKKRAAKFV